MCENIEITLNRGDILYREGDSNDFAYIIESGEVILYNSRDGKRTDCERRGAGCIIGELSILADQPRTVTVEAVTPCRLFRISSDQILRHLEKVDPILRACIDTSIHFSATLNQHRDESGRTVPVVPTTLRNAPELISQLKFEQDILAGLVRDEFFLAYQPIVRLSDCAIVGFEALMRWDHDELGAVSPLRFIGVAEAMGSIGRLTHFALHEACAALKRLELMGLATPSLFMSVNISGKDIEHDCFVDTVAQALEKNDLSPANLRLEITETALVNDPEGAATRLGRLRDLGCGIAIDDFGTGYSNLAYLKKLPFTALKIDRTFAGDAHANAVARSIVRMLLGLGEELGVDIVAEGLETVHDVNTLHDLGCGFAQGYYFSKPLPEAELVMMLESTGIEAKAFRLVA